MQLEQMAQGTVKEVVAVEAAVAAVVEAAVVEAAVVGTVKKVDVGLKTTEEKLKESIHILSQLREAGISHYDPSYKELSTRFSDWVKGTEVWSGTIAFYRYNRKAVINLPQKKKYTAKVDFLHHVYTE